MSAKAGGSRAFSSTISSFFGLGLIAVVFAACAIPMPGREIVYERPHLRSITFSSPDNNPATLSFQEGSATAQTVAVTFDPADFPNKNIAWSSLNGRVTISPTGPNTALVTGLGTAGQLDTIFAVPVGGGAALQKTCAVVFTTAPAVPVQGISLSQTTLSVATGAQTSLTVDISPDNASDQTVNWTITTTGAGTATFLSSGTTATTTTDGSSVTIVGGTPGSGVVVTATPTDQTNTVAEVCNVTVTDTPVTGVALDETALTIIEAGTAVLKATVSPTGATDSSVTWSTDNNGATLTSQTHTGDNSTTTINVNSLAAGTVFHVTATSNQDNTKLEVCTVTVAPAASSLTLNTSSQFLLPGESFTIVKTVNPSNAAIAWTVAPPGVATVDANGKVTAVGPGTAVVTATSAALVKTCDVTVGDWQPPMGGGTVPGITLSGGGVKMAVDSTGKTYLAYVDGSGNGKIRVFNGISWVTPANDTFSTSVITPNPLVSPYPSLGSAGTNIALAIDSGDNLYVAYPEVVAAVPQLTISKYNGTTWSVVGNPVSQALAGKPTGEPRYLTMAADGTTVYLSFADGGAGVGGAPGNTFGATTMMWNGSAWSLPTPRGGTNAPELYLSLAVHPISHSYVLAAVNNGFFEAYDSSGSVIGFMSPSPTPTQPRFLSQAIDSNGKLYVAYQNAQNSDTATVITSTGATWSYFTPSLGTGAVSSGAATNVTMAIGNGITPYVAFQDSANGDVATVMKFNGTAWVSMTGTLSTGVVTDLAIAADPTGLGLFMASVDESGEITVRRLQ